jgi:hypothetical protein
MMTAEEIAKVFHADSVGKTIQYYDEKLKKWQSHSFGMAIILQNIADGVIYRVKPKPVTKTIFEGIYTCRICCITYHANCKCMTAGTIGMEVDGVPFCGYCYDKMKKEKAEPKLRPGLPTRFR